MTELQGKNAFISWWDQRNWSSNCQKMAEEGANVAFTYHKSQDEAQAMVQEIEAKGVKGLAIQADAMQAENVVLSQIINDR